MKFLNIEIKNPKIKALFNEITPQEFILSCFPFLVTFVTTRGISQNPFSFVFTAISFIFGFGVLYIIGIRWRVLYFSTLVLFSIFLVIYIGKPWEYWLLADRDSAIRVGIEAILNGENPYKTRTNLQNLPTPLPFTFLLYLPLYLITGGYTFYMNIIILSAFSIITYYRFINTQRETLILPIISFIVFSDYFFLEIAMNSDLINSGLLLCLLVLLLPEKIPEQKKFSKYIPDIVPQEPREITKSIIVFSVFLGCLLAMRIHFWLVGPILLLYILKNFGLKKAVLLTSLTGAVFLAIMLPFMLQDLNYFINVNPLAHNAVKFAYWRNKGSVQFPGQLVIDLLDFFLNFGRLNSIIITIGIILFSLIIGIFKIRNLFDLLLIISLCYVLFLFFYLFSPLYPLLGDYVSIAAVPLTFSFLFISLKNGFSKIIRNKDSNQI